MCVALATTTVLTVLLYCLVASEAQVKTDVDYFDRLRDENSFLVTWDESFENSKNNLFRVGDVAGDNYTLASFSSFLALTDGEKPKHNVLDDALAGLLAAYHFNNPSESPFLNQTEMEKCDLRLTVEFFDSNYSPISSTQTFTSILSRNHSLHSPLPAAVVGSLRSAVSSPMAILTGVNSIPQVSYGSTSADFDIKEQYPFFGRTVQSSVGEAKVAVEFFQSIGATHVGILFVTDSYGSALQKAFQDASSVANITTDSVAFSYSIEKGGDEIKSAMEGLKSRQYRIFYVICFESHFEPIMGEAHKQGMIGDEFLWIFESFTLEAFHERLVFDAGSPLAKATNGIGIIVTSGGVLANIHYPDDDKVTPVQDNPTEGYQLFRKLYREASLNSTFVDFLRSKVPSSDPTTLLRHETTNWGAMVYDAFTGMGIAYCRALLNAPEGTEIGGPEAFEFFKTLDMEGASGRVLIDPDTGTRNYTTLTRMLVNVRAYDLNDDGKQVYTIVPTNYYGNNKWQPIIEQNGERQFIYADGGTTIPKSLPPPNINYNYIGQSGRIVGYVLLGIVVASSLVSMIWLFFFRGERVIRSSQPLFLLLVSLGSITMASTIVPLGMEEPTNLQGLNTACMASPWLYLSGSLLAIGALVAKTRGVFQAYSNPELEFIHVTPLDLLLTCAILFILNLIVMIPWTVMAPWSWDRSFTDSTDRFNRKVESYGVCSNDDSTPFIASVLILNLFVVAMGNWWSYQSRNIETEYQESRYIGIALASILQAWAMGIPILIVVSSNPQAKFFVSSGIVFVTAEAVQLLIFVPKMLAIRTDRKKTEEGDGNKALTLADKLRDSVYDPACIIKKETSRSIRSTEESHEEGTLAIGATRADETEELPSAQKPAGKPSLRTSAMQSLRLMSTTRLDAPSSDDRNLRSLKVVHNPRSQRNLEVSGGMEYSRAQLQVLEDQYGAFNEKDEVDGARDDGDETGKKNIEKGNEEVDQRLAGIHEEVKSLS